MNQILPFLETLSTKALYCNSIVLTQARCNCLCFLLCNLLNACGPHSSPSVNSSPVQDGPDARAQVDGADSGGAASSFHFLGYYTGDQTSYADLMKSHESHNMVSFAIFQVDYGGSIIGSDDYSAVAYDVTAGIESYACISNYSNSLYNFDPALAHDAMVTNKLSAISNILQLASTGYAGVNVDFENLAYSANVADDRTAYSAFVHDLSLALHAEHLKLIISA